MPNDEVARGLELFSRLCEEAGLAIIPPEQVSFESETIPISVGRAVSSVNANTSQDSFVTLSYEFLSDLPGTREYQERLNEYLHSLSRRLENPEVDAFVTLSGIPVFAKIEWPLRHSPSGRDAFSLRTSLKVKSRNRIANLWTSISGTLKVVAFQSLTPVYTESPILNGIRKAIDKQSIQFLEPPLHPVTLQEVWLTTSDYEGRKGFSFQKASDGEIRQFILRKVYWLGFNEGDQSTEVWICDPYDAEYLGTTTNHLKQLAQILAAEDLIRFDTTRTFAAASNFLLKQSSMFEEELHAAIEGRPTVGQPYREPDRTTATKPSAFISYSSQDNAFAERLASDLKARKLGVWFDKWEICVGDSLMQKIGQGIRENDYLIVVLSPDSVASEWVKKELAEAMQREIAEKRVVVLPILYRQCQRPPFLADKKYANFTKTYEEGFGELLRGFSLMGGRLIPTESEAVNQPGRVSRPDLADVESGVQATHNETDDRVFERLAIDEARKSVPEDERIHPRVGVVVVKDGRVLATAHRGEIPQCHGEYIALERKLPEVPLPGATVYTTLEPCTSRNHPKVPCAIRLTERKVARVVIGMLDPDIRIRGSGMWTLRQAGIAIELFPHDLMTEIEELNRDFIRERESAQKKGPIPERKRADLVVAVHEGSAFLRHFLNGKPVGTYLHINASVENKGNRGSVVSRYHLRIEETGTNEDVRPNPSSAVQGPKSTWFANTLSKNLAPGGFIRVQPDNLAGPDILPFYVVAVPPEDCHVLHCTLEITDSNGEQAMCEFELHERVQ